MICLDAGLWSTQFIDLIAAKADKRDHGNANAFQHGRHPLHDEEFALSTFANQICHLLFLIHNVEEDIDLILT